MLVQKQNEQASLDLPGDLSDCETISLRPSDGVLSVAIKHSRHAIQPGRIRLGRGWLHYRHHHNDVPAPRR